MTGESTVYESIRVVNHSVSNYLKMYSKVHIAE